MKNDEIRNQIFEITESLNTKIKMELINLVYELSNNEYKEGITQGAKIAKEVFSRI